MRRIRLSLAQINPVVGDLNRNARKIISYINKAKKLKAELIAFPELAVTGYPPEDLLLKPKFIEDNIDAMHKIKKASKGIVTIAGFVDSRDGLLFNAASIISNCRLIDIYHKKHLPNYGVFDEYRYFQAGNRYPVYSLNGINFGVNICEDIWYKNGPANIQALSGAELIININASPYHVGKAEFRKHLVSTRALENHVTIAYVNMTGGQDELVFDGGSFILDTLGKTILKGKQFEEELITFDLEFKNAGPGRNKKSRSGNALTAKKEKAEKIKIQSADSRGRKPALNVRKPVEMLLIEEVYNALVLGTRDYVIKNGFKTVVIGMSGGVDSALVASIAVDAVGKENVHGLFMPSAYTSKESYDDAGATARNLGIKLITVSINSVFKEYLKTLSKSFKKTGPDITEENLQARIRGNILMAFSNKFGRLVLTTGNKSEMSVGYATLYGDMAGGFAVIKDVPKTMVYDLCNWKNSKERREIIPETVISKEPSAELKPGQRDVDTLPPYPELDPILKAFIEENKSVAEMKKRGYNVKYIKQAVEMVYHSEYKRRQAPPGIKITARAFGKDRRFPITNRYRSK